MIVDDIKKSILQEAFSGKLTKQSKDDSSFKNNNLLNLNSITKKGKFIFDESNLYEIPESWIWIKLDNIITILGDGLHGTPEFDVNGEYFFVNGNNLKNGQIILKQETKRVSKNEYNKYKKNLNCNTMFISINGTIGNIGFYNNEKIILGKSACYFNLLDFVNKKYLYYFFESKWALDYMINNATGTTIKNVSLDVMRNIRIPFAPIEEQIRIVNKIEKMFAKLDEIRPIADELINLKNKFPNEMKNSILLDAFLGNWSKETHSNWNEFKLNSLAEIYTGNSISESIKKSKYTNLAEGYNYIGTKDLNFDHSFKYDNGVKIPYNEIGFKYAKENDILMCIEGGSAGKKIGILNEKVCFGNKLCKFSANEDIINYKFLYYYLQSPIFLRNFRDNLNGIIGGVSINKIKQLTIKIPSLEEQIRIVDKLEKLLPMCADIANIINY